MDELVQDKTHLENRAYWHKEITPLLRHKRFKLLRKNMVYEKGVQGMGGQEALDEIMIKVYANPRGWANKGWVGYDPWHLRQADGDDPGKLVRTLRGISSGEIPPAAIQNLMSIPHQVRIKFGVSAMPKQLLDRNRYESDNAMGASKTMDKLFDQNSKVENAIRKFYRNNRADAQPGVVEAAVAKELAELEHRPEGLIDQFGRPIIPEQEH